jgi:hypothetical protein
MVVLRSSGRCVRYPAVCDPRTNGAGQNARGVSIRQDALFGKVRFRQSGQDPKRRFPTYQIDAATPAEVVRAERLSFEMLGFGHTHALFPE